MNEYSVPTDVLADRVILVTGAAAGIGQSASIAFAKAGATVLLLGRTEDSLAETYDAIESAGYPSPALLPFDLKSSKPADYQTIGKVIEDNFGRLDGLLHNASALGSLSPIEHYEVATWYEVMHVNANAPFLLSQACLPLLRLSEQASVIFTSSGVATKGRAYWGAYSASKFATLGLMEVLADELESSKIRVNAINPGATRTKMRAAAFPGEDPDTLTSPDSLMPLYLWLMSGVDQSVHGQNINAQ